MTTPPGAPDWQDFTSTKSANLFTNFSITRAPGTYNTAIFPVVNWSSLALNVRVTAGQAIIQVTHYADQAGTQIIGSDRWFIRPTHKLTVITPLRGPYVQVTTQITGGVNTPLLQYCTFLSAFASKIDFPVGFQSAGINGFTAPISSTAFYDIPSICAGAAQLKFIPSDAAGKLRLRIIATDETGGTLFSVADYGLPTTSLNVGLQVPDLPIVVQIDNTDAVAVHTYDVELIVPPQ